MGKREDVTGVVFEDHFPAMVEKLGAEGFMNELCKGFEVLMDSHKQLITFHSLKKNAVVLGLQVDDDDMLRCMLKEGDLDGDGCLDQMEFCVLMFRLSPNLMNRATDILFQDVD
ncbi:calcium-binding protein PBP1-like [Salvia miltiorrhiza]|uniref:calcium-binding protein PBP1-like n=1 Tax=Salvia miltiorrhiza TaxID=226208 RepID=UPI0025ACE6FA|nr:calcium-binding protein PBP1-like [Salvia miltiorrhiza]